MSDIKLIRVCATQTDHVDPMSKPIEALAPSAAHKVDAFAIVCYADDLGRDLRSGYLSESADQKALHDIMRRALALSMDNPSAIFCNMIPPSIMCRV